MEEGKHVIHDPMDGVMAWSPSMNWNHPVDSVLFQSTPVDQRSYRSGGLAVAVQMERDLRNGACPGTVMRRSDSLTH